MALIAPSMLSADFLHLEKDIRTVNSCADIFHLDIMDGVLVPNISYGFPVVEAIASKAEKPMDAHLMIIRPEKYVERFAQTGVSMLSAHLEAMEDPVSVMGQIRSYGIKAGIAFNPDIPVEKVFPYLDSCDFVLVMSVFAGFGGQKFIEATFGRVQALKAEILRRGLDVKIEVDGGVSPANSAALAEAGADILVAGSAVFRSDDPAAAVSAMR
ncbi:MAG: ribulose-phosphate 3-epimerase [Bacteroidetes bacterium]|uniref:Ribulose-phosphate 3-epimerase n=1 Tax=Candidatus Cryptobacteroides avicola TaxID=2840757 RepID=A0A940E0U1_9BACT|nr:ribulose-phosphate 3-epimerase [Candidatus Cryptobacteroides avicola]